LLQATSLETSGYTLIYHFCTPSVGLAYSLVGHKAASDGLIPIITKLWVCHQTHLIYQHNFMAQIFVIKKGFPLVNSNSEMFFDYL